MRLTNKKTGAQMDVTLRPFCPEDAEALISCIRDAYGDTYVKPVLYTPEGVLACCESGEIAFVAAQRADGALAGITAVEISGLFPGQGEIACQVIRRDCSGFGLALPLALYQMERAERMGFSSLFARALGTHAISQKTLMGMGFTACGFLLSVFDREKFRQTSFQCSSVKIAQSLAVKRESKRSAGAVYVPRALAELAGRMYRGLGMDWSPVHEAREPEGEDVWDRELDGRHDTLTLWSRTCGAGFGGRLAREVAAMEGRPLGTVNLYLNLNRPGSGGAWAEARRQGFVFTGFFPGGEGEYAVLHHPLRVPVRMEDVPYIAEYAPIAAEIGRELHER